MELFVIPKGSKFLVQDTKGRLIYTIKKKGFSGKLQLYDASNYELYTMVSDFSEKHPSFQILLNDKLYLWAKCKSRFLDPSLVAEGETGKYLMKSQDREHFDFFKDDVPCGNITIQQMPNGDTQFHMEIDDKSFDDALPLFTLCIDYSFVKYK